MEILIFLGIGVIVFVVYSIMNGNLSFWKIAAKHPDEVFRLMLDDKDIWVVDIGDGDTWEGKDQSDYSGPFRLFVPSINTFVKIYGKANQIESAQAEILKKLT